MVVVSTRRELTPRRKTRSPPVRSWRHSNSKYSISTSWVEEPKIADWWYLELLEPERVNHVDNVEEEVAGQAHKNQRLSRKSLNIFKKCERTWFGADKQLFYLFTCLKWVQRKRPPLWWGGSVVLHSNPDTFVQQQSWWWHFVFHFSTPCCSSYIRKILVCCITLHFILYGQTTMFFLFLFPTWTPATSFWVSIWTSGKSSRLSQIEALWPRFTCLWFNWFCCD